MAALLIIDSVRSIRISRDCTPDVSIRGGAAGNIIKDMAFLSTILLLGSYNRGQIGLSRNANIEWPGDKQGGIQRWRRQSLWADQSGDEVWTEGQLIHLDTQGRQGV